MIDKISEFRRAFELFKADKPTLKHTNDINLSISLIDEEFKELTEALNNNDLVGVLDAVGDLYFVLEQFTDSIGVTDLVPKVIEEIYNSNMSKLCNSYEEAETTRQLYNSGNHPSKPGEFIPVAIIELDNKYCVKHAITNKLLKSYLYKEPDLKQFL